MPFAIIAHDGTDSEALTRRMKARPDHLAYTSQYQEHVCMAAALLNDSGVMHGSIMIVDFETREAVEAWLENEPYVKQGVWKHIEILPCAIAPAFQKVVK